jgi:D-alanyl-D-alanine carboxypeptidase
MVVSLTRGDTLYAYNAGEPMLPASTMKLLTSAIAFERFGPTYQFSTDALRDGAVGPDGTLTGNLYIRGDGDPALSGKFLPGGPSAPMNKLADLVAQKGIKRITGNIIGDASGFDDQKIPEGWLTRYLQAGYAARVSALSLNENLIAVAVTPTTPGKPAVVTLDQRDWSGRQRSDSSRWRSASRFPEAKRWHHRRQRIDRLARRHAPLRLHRRRPRELHNRRLPLGFDRSWDQGRRWNPARENTGERRQGRCSVVATACEHDSGDESGKHQPLRGAAVQKRCTRTRP